MKPILASVPWRTLGSDIRAETANREVHQPLVSLYRWWARRPHSLIGAILDSARETVGDSLVVADPFSGGGTVAVECARRGIPVYAQDVNPWAAWGLNLSLTPVDPVELAKAGAEFLDRLRQQCLAAYRMTGDGIRECHEAHTFRVRHTCCSGCGRGRWHFPYALVTVASRKETEQSGFFGCRACGAVRSHRLDTPAPACDACGTPIRATADVECPHCRRPDAGGGRVDAEWRIVLVQRLWSPAHGKPVLDFAEPAPEACESPTDGRWATIPPAGLRRAIPDGLETRKLLRFGFRTWADLYPARQRVTLLAAVDVLDQMSIDSEVRERLRLCLAGATEMAGHLCRWDRTHPKIFEALANHRYSFDGLAVEPNPLSPAGRGSLARRIAASVTAANWLRRNVARPPTVGYYLSKSSALPPGRRRSVTVVQGSSERLLLPDRSVKLVLTDPPYYDCVQYGELASMLLAWSPALGLQRHAGVLDLRREAVPNRARAHAAAGYQRKLTKIFGECRRVLAADGRLILTYHSSQLYAWSALGQALARNGFRVSGLAVAHTENGQDHAKRGKRSLLVDLLIECVLSDVNVPLQILRRPQTPEEREIVRVGEAMAEVGAGSYMDMRRNFLAKAGKMRHRLISSPLPILPQKAVRSGVTM